MTTLSQPATYTQQVEFELFEGGRVTLDVELPVGTDAIEIWVTEYDESGNEVNNESLKVGPTPMPNQLPPNLLLASVK